MTSPLLTDGPHSDPFTSPSLSSTGMFFSQTDNATPVPEPTVDPETGAPIPSLHLVDGPGSASGSEWNDDEWSGAPSAPTSSPDSSTGRPNPLSKRAAKDTARAAVHTAGVMSHRLLANTNGKVQAQLFLTDEEDEAAIGDPLGNLAHRHSGKLGDAVSEDTADLMQAMFGVAGYFAKQINNIAAARRIDGIGLQQAQAVPEAA